MLSELPFYKELNVVKTNHAFRGYTMSYKVELVEKKDPIKQLEASKSSIKDLFNDLLNETKDFKSYIKKYKQKGEIEFTPVYFNSTTKTVINHKFSLKNVFQEILYRIDNWINERSGWIIELIESRYINISTHRPLWGSSYIKLPTELRSPKKELINIKNNYQKCFLLCHVRHINPVKINSEKIMHEDKKLANDLNYDGVKFPAREKDFSKIEEKNNICINVLGYENRLPFLIYISDQKKIDNSIGFLLIINKSKWYYVYIKDLCLTKQKIRTKNTFAEVVCSVLVVKMYWQNIKKFEH